MSIVKTGLMNALRSRYEADIQEGLSTLLIYFNNPVGIGEHPQHIEEMDKLLEKMSASHDKLEMLSRCNDLLINNNSAMLDINRMPNKCPYYSNSTSPAPGPAPEPSSPPPNE